MSENSIWVGLSEWKRLEFAKMGFEMSGKDRMRVCERRAADGSNLLHKKKKKNSKENTYKK